MAPYIGAVTASLSARRSSNSSRDESRSMRSTARRGMNDREQLRKPSTRGFGYSEIELRVDAVSAGKALLIVKRGWTSWTPLRHRPR